MTTNSGFRPIKPPPLHKRDHDVGLNHGAKRPGGGVAALKVRQRHERLKSAF